MSSSLRLSEDAVRGSSSSYSISPEALSALQAGDTAALIASHRDRFGGFQMKETSSDDDDDDDDDPDDDDDDTDDDDEDEEDSDDDDDDDDDGPEGKKSKKGEDKAKKGDPQAKIRALEDEKNRLFRGRQRARDERDDLQRQLDKLKKDGTGDEELKKSVSNLEKSNEKLNEQLRQARIENAFLSDNSHEWHDPGVALKSVDLSDLEIDDDGKVHGLASALETLAEDKPFLLKDKNTKKDPPKERSQTPSGQRKQRRPNKSKQAAERERVKEKYGIQRGRG